MSVYHSLIKNSLIIGVVSLLSGLSFAQSNNLNTSQAKVTQSGASMKLGKAVSNPRLGQEFSIYVKNNGNTRLTNIHIASHQKQLNKGNNQCAKGLSPGKTCQIKITGASKKLAGTHAISVASKQASSQSINVHFTQPSIQSNFESSQPFKPGQTITLDVQAGTPVSPDANVNPAQVSYSLENVQAQPKNGQLIPQNNQSGSNNTCSSSPCKFQFKVKQSKNLQGGQPAKIKLTSQYGKTTNQKADLVAMAANPSTSKPILGQTFHVTVANRGNKNLSGIKVTSDKKHLNIKNSCSGGLSSGQGSTCKIFITGNSPDLVGQSKTIQISSDQAKSVSTSVQFQKQQGIQAQFKSSGPLKPGQTVTVTATPKGSGQIKLPDVTATSRNGQLKPSSTSSQTCSKSSPCKFKFTVKQVGDLTANKPAQVKVSSSYAAKSAKPGADIQAMTISANKKAYLGNKLPVTVVNKGSVKLSGIRLATSSKKNFKVDNNGCKNGLNGGDTCKINITGQKVGNNQTITIDSKQAQSISTTVTIKKPSFSASIIESGPFKPGQPLEVKVSPKQSGQFKLHGVTAKPQNGQLTSADHASKGKTCSHASPCHFQFNLKKIGKLKINTPAKVKVTSNNTDSPMKLTANVVGMTLSTQDDHKNKPYLGKPFKVVVTNHGSQKLTNIHVTDSDGLKVDNNCSNGLPAGKNSTCDIDITGDSTQLAGKSKTITIDSDQTDTHSVKETFQKQQGISANFESDGPFKSGQTVKVKVKPTMSDATLKDVTAKSVNGQLTSADNASKTCSNDSPCTFKLTVKNADKLQPNTQAKVQVTSSFASSSANVTGDIAAMVLQNVPKIAKVGDTIKIKVVPKSSTGSLHNIAAQSLTNLKLNQDKTKCPQNKKTGSCVMAFDVKNNHSHIAQAAKGTITSQHANSAQFQVNTVAIKPSWPSSKPFVGKAFQVKVTNQGSTTLNDLSIAGKGLSKNKSDTTCGSSLTSGKSCHFSVTSSKQNTKIKLSAHSKTGNQSVKASHKQRFKQPKLNLSIKDLSTPLKPKDTFKVIVKPKGDNIKYYNVHAQSVNGQLKNITSDQITEPSSTNSSRPACPKKGTIQKQCYYQFQVKQAKHLTAGQQAQVKVQSKNAKTQKTQQFDIAWMNSSITHQTLGTGQTTKLTIHNKGSQTLTNLSAGLSDGLQLKNNEQVSSDSSNCGDKLKAGKSCHFTITTNMPTDTSQTIQPSSEQTGQGNKYSITVVKPKLQITHTLIGGPGDHYVKLQNVSTQKGDTVKPYLKLTSWKRNGGPGSHVKVYHPSEVTQLDSNNNQKPLCKVQNSLQPGSSCWIHLHADKNAHGTLYLQVKGNFQRQQLHKVPLNVVPSFIRLKGKAAVYIRPHDNSRSKFTGMPFFYMPRDKTSTERFELQNKGPFKLTNIQYHAGKNKYGHKITDYIQSDCSSLNSGVTCLIKMGEKYGHKQDLAPFHITADQTDRMPPMVAQYGGKNTFTNFGKNAWSSADTLTVMLPVTKKPKKGTSYQKVHYSNSLTTAQFVVQQYWSGFQTDVRDESKHNNAVKTSHKNTYRCGTGSLQKLDPCYKKFSALLTTHHALTNGLKVFQYHLHSPNGGRHNATAYAVAKRSLIVGGDFARVTDSNGNDMASSTALMRYDADGNWHPMATLSNGDSINAMLMGWDKFVVAGHFKSMTYQGHPVRANNIAYWNGAEWQSYGKGVTNSSGTAKVNALAAQRGGHDSIDKLFVGGQFSKAGNQSAHNFVYYTDKKPNVPNHSPKSGQVYALLAPESSNIVWVGGDFDKVGANDVSGLAAYDYISKHWWSSGSTNKLKGIGNHKPVVYSFAYIPQYQGQSDGAIVAAGHFKICNSSDDCSYGLAIRDLNPDQVKWKPFFPSKGTGKQGKKPKLTGNDLGIKTVKFFSHNHKRELLVGGTFNTASGDKTHYEAFDLDNKQWKQEGNLSQKINGPVYAQAYTTKNLYVGGDFSAIANEKAGKVAKSQLNREGAFWQSLSGSSEVEGSGKQIHGGKVKALGFMDEVVAKR